MAIHQSIKRFGLGGAMLISFKLSCSVRFNEERNSQYSTAIDYFK